MATKKEMLLAEEIKEAKIQEKTSTLEALTVRELNDLEDVSISSPTNGQHLMYNSTSGKWENTTP